MTLTHAQRRARRAEIAECVRNGMQACEVARQFGVSVHTVDNACRELGMTRTNVAEGPEGGDRGAAGAGGSDGVW